MDSESRAFEAPVEASLSGTPLRCPRPMIAQPLVPWTMARILMAGLGALQQNQPAASEARQRTIGGAHRHSDARLQ